MTTAMFIITSNNKTPQSLRRHSCLLLLQHRDNGGLSTAHSGRVCAKMTVSLSNLGRGLGKATSHSQESVNHLNWERAYYLWGLKKKHWVDFYRCRVDVYTYWQHTFMFKQHLKVNFTSDYPFKSRCAFAPMISLEIIPPNRNKM